MNNELIRRPRATTAEPTTDQLIAIARALAERPSPTRLPSATLVSAQLSAHGGSRTEAFLELMALVISPWRLDDDEAVWVHQVRRSHGRSNPALWEARTTVWTSIHCLEEQRVLEPVIEASLTEAV